MLILWSLKVLMNTILFMYYRGKEPLLGFRGSGPKFTVGDTQGAYNFIM